MESTELNTLYNRLPKRPESGNTTPVPVTNLLGLTCAILRRVVRGMGVCRHLARLRIRITTHRLRHAKEFDGSLPTCCGAG